MSLPAVAIPANSAVGGNAGQWLPLDYRGQWTERHGGPTLYKGKDRCLYSSQCLLNQGLQWCPWSHTAFFSQGKSKTVKGKLADGATSITPWRKAEVSYLKDEFILDIVEEIDALVDT